MRTNLHVSVLKSKDGFSHYIVHRDSVIALARDLQYGGDIVPVPGEPNSCKAPPGKLLLHRLWLRPIPFPLSEVN